MMKTYTTKAKDIKREWHLVDLEGKVLGRITSEISNILQGKHKVYYTRNLDCGDYVVAINAAKIKITGKKADSEFFHRHSNFPGGFKTVTLAQQMIKDPAKAVMLTIKNMLPKNKHRDQRMARFKVFPSAEHTYKDKFSKK